MAVQIHGLVAGPIVRSDVAPDHRLKRCGAVTALISDFTDIAGFAALPPDKVAEWALAHHAILAAYCGDMGVLPMQVGAVFSDETALCAAVLDQEDTHVRSLRTLDGLREYTVQLRVLEDAPVSVAASPTGRDHLRARHAARAHRETRVSDRQVCARTILKALDRIAMQISPTGGPKPGRLLDCALLVPVDAVSELHDFTKQQYDVAAALGLDLQIAGPWPPYSFDAVTLPCRGVQDGG